MKTGTVATAGTASCLSRANVVRVAAYRDARPLRERQEKQKKHILATYNKAYDFFPKVKFVLKHNSRLGEVWKVTGDSPELGSWVPEVSPTLSWREGGVWSCEVALPPGTYNIKCMLRTLDGSYVWETGSNRQVTVPVKDRPGNFVITYQMDVRTEPVESLPVQQQQPLMQPAGRYSPMQQQGGGQQQDLWERAMANGRVTANAW